MYLSMTDMTAIIIALVAASFTIIIGMVVIYTQARRIHTLKHMLMGAVHQLFPDPAEEAKEIDDEWAAYFNNKGKWED